QYFDWMFGVFQGDMGNSIRTGRPVAATIIDRLPVTASLAVIAIIATAIIGTALGLVSALRGGAIGKVAQVGSVIGTSLPNFWLGILLVLFFAVILKWLPATGYVPLERSPSEWAESLVLPVVAITVAAVAAIARQTRSA